MFASDDKTKDVLKDYLIHVKNKIQKCSFISYLNVKKYSYIKSHTHKIYF